LEAFATALYILGYNKDSEKILNIYKWAPHFLDLNKKPLEEYQKATSSSEVVDIMKQYLSS